MRPSISLSIDRATDHVGDMGARPVLFSTAWWCKGGRRLRKGATDHVSDMGAQPVLLSTAWWCKGGRRLRKGATDHVGDMGARNLEI